MLLVNGWIRSKLNGYALLLEHPYITLHLSHLRQTEKLPIQEGNISHQRIHADYLETCCTYAPAMTFIKDSGLCAHTAHVQNAVQYVQIAVIFWGDIRLTRRNHKNSCKMTSFHQGADLTSNHLKTNKFLVSRKVLSRQCCRWFASLQFNRFTFRLTFRHVRVFNCPNFLDCTAKTVNVFSLPVRPLIIGQTMEY